MRIFFLTISLFFTAILFSQSKNYYLFVGGYTTGKNEGISVYRFNAADGSVTFVSKIKTDNPSYLAISNNGKYLYSANEAGKGRQGFTSAFSIDKKTGTLTQLNQQSVGGNGPCFVAVDKTNKWLITANYSSGSVSVLSLKNDGSIDTLQKVLQHIGNSVEASRQKEPHAHTAMFSPSGKQLFTTDLGTDKINIYQFKTSEKSMPLVVSADSVLYSKPGNGPRHIAFHPSNKLMYVINELSGTIDVFDVIKANRLVQTISTDTSNSLDKGSADIHFSPDGKFLYATNRSNYNNLVIYKVVADGTLQYISLQPTMGKTPRNFIIDPMGNFLLVALQNSDSVIIFKRDKKTGLLTLTNNIIEVGNPTCLKLLAIE